MKILRQLEIVIMCMPYILRQSMLSLGQNGKNKIIQSFALASWPCQHQIIDTQCHGQSNTALCDPSSDLAILSETGSGLRDLARPLRSDS